MAKEKPSRLFKKVKAALQQSYQDGTVAQDRCLCVQMRRWS